MLATGTFCMCVHTPMNVQKQVRVHKHTCIHICTTAFLEKDYSPKWPQRENRNGEGGCRVLSHSLTVLLCSNLRDNQHQSLIFLQVSSGLSPHLGGTHRPGSTWLHHLPGCSHFWGARLGTLALLWWQCHQLWRGTTVFSEPGAPQGYFKRTLKVASQLTYKIVLLSY